jgi:hypothetical protein
MKTTLFTILFSLTLLTVSFGQLVEISGDITSDMTLTNNRTYKLIGFVRVQPPATLTIQEGTLIVGDNASQGTLIVKPGGKINANGTQNAPIIFTSEFALAGSGSTPTYGDWGGIIILGNAKLNVPGGIATIEGPGDNYGGTNDDDNSGVMRYVRIEYAGIPFSLNNEINGLTLGGVGRGTTIEYIQVSFCGDDSYEWFGGTVNAKYLVAFRGWDDEFDTDFGFTGKLQYLVGIRDPEIADQSSSNGFESDNDGSGSLNEPITSPTWWNVTLIGPLEDSSTPINSLYRRGMHLRRSSRNKISNAVIMGWPTGIRLDGGNTIQAAMDGTMWINNSIVSGWTSAAMDTVSSGGRNFNINTWFTNSGGRTFATNAEVMLTDPFNLDNPDLTPLAGSPVLTGGATPPNDGFFDPSGTFLGGIGTDNWMANWTNFNPNAYPVSVEETELPGIPNAFELSQNYPNPFNPSTKIVYSIAEASNVKITVFDVLGREVDVLVDEFKPAGIFELTYDASDLPSGLYLYSLKTASTKITKKMTLLK